MPPYNLANHLYDTRLKIILIMFLWHAPCDSAYLPGLALLRLDHEVNTLALLQFSLLRILLPCIYTRGAGRELRPGF